MPVTACSRCPSAATRRLWSEVWCEQCYALVTAPMRERVATPDGLNPFAGICRGPGHWDAELNVYAKACDTCHAGTWSVHDRDEHCWHCHRAYLRLIGDSTDTVLSPPDLDDELNDRDWNHAISAWMERLDRAIAAGVITVHEASNAYQRATRGRHRGAA